jgi:hypothetical protein
MDHLVDGRGMQPPEPFERTLEALDQLVAEEDQVVLLLHCVPQPLFNVLRRNGYVWHEEPGPDGCFAYKIRKGPALSGT